MNMKGMELRASADLVALISPTTMAKRGDNMKLIQDLGDAMKTLSLSSMVTNWFFVYFLQGEPTKYSPKKQNP